MTKAIWCMVVAATLGACSAGSKAANDGYDMTADDARRILLSTDFERGVLPGSEKLKPRVWTNHDGVVEWTVLNDANKSGWWCPLSIEAASEDAKKTRVVNQCVGVMSGQRNAMLDELVDAALTDRAPKFDKS
ncbi:hypothetical protein [Sphingopyxis fribergensis]